VSGGFRTTDRPSRRVPGLVTLVSACAAVAVALVLLWTGEEPPAPVASASSATEYRAQFRESCVVGHEKLRKVSEAHPEGTPVDSLIAIHRAQLERVRLLSPPDELRTDHDRVIQVWTERITFLQQVSDRASAVDTAEFRAARTASTDAARRLNDMFRVLEVSECIY